MLREGRKQPRTPERFLVQISAARNPRVALASAENLSPRGARVTTERFFEPGSHVDVRLRVRGVTMRARVVYCKPVSANLFVVGLNFLSQTIGPNPRSEPDPSKEQR